MIRSDADLAFLKEQLGRVEAAYRDLEQDVRPKSEKWFQLMAESYLDQIAKLRREIDDYRSTRQAEGADPSAGPATVPVRKCKPA